MIRRHILDLNYNIKFPYETFPWRLDFEKTICHFECEEHLQKYLDRCKLKPRDYKVLNRDGKSLKSSQKHKTKLQSSTGKGGDGSTSTVRRRKSSVDSTRNTTSNSKRKK